MRQALSYTFDYDTMVKAAFQGHGTRMLGVGPTGLANYFPAPHLYTYDLAKAKSLLAQAGYAQGFPLEVDWQTGDFQSALMAQIWQADTKPLGIQMNLHVLPNSMSTLPEARRWIPTRTSGSASGRWTSGTTRTCI